jgi:4a-hydroxytetrahydrobiopterin dehydratase
MKSILSILTIIIIIFLVSIDSVKANDRPTSLIVLTETQISEQLKTLPEWTIKNQQLIRIFEFENFVRAITFVDSLVEPAERLAHHPDLFISYNRVTVSLTTHDVGGLTQQDFDLAKIISDLFATER